MSWWLKIYTALYRYFHLKNAGRTKRMGHNTCTFIDGSVWWEVKWNVLECHPLGLFIKDITRAVGWGVRWVRSQPPLPPPPPLGHRRSARPTSRPRSAHRLVKSRILSGSSPLFSPNYLKSPLNWLKCTQKILPHAPPLSSHPGSATDTATPRGRHCHSPDTLNTLSPQGWYIGPIYAPSGACTLIQAGERVDSVRITLYKKVGGIFWEGGVNSERC